MMARQTQNHVRKQNGIANSRSRQSKEGKKIRTNPTSIAATAVVNPSSDGECSGGEGASGLVAKLLPKEGFRIKGRMSQKKRKAKWKAKARGGLEDPVAVANAVHICLTDVVVQVAHCVDVGDGTPRIPVDITPEQFTGYRSRFTRMQNKRKNNKNNVTTGIELEPMNNLAQGQLKRQRFRCYFGRAVQADGWEWVEKAGFFMQTHVPPPPTQLFKNRPTVSWLLKEYIVPPMSKIISGLGDKKKLKTSSELLKELGENPKDEKSKCARFLSYFSDFRQCFQQEYRSYAAVLMNLDESKDLERFVMRIIFRILAGPRIENHPEIPAYLPDLEYALDSLKTCETDIRIFPYQSKNGIESCQKLRIPDPRLVEYVRTSFELMRIELADMILPFFQTRLNRILALRSVSEQKQDILTEFMDPFPAPVDDKELVIPEDELFSCSKCWIYQRGAPWFSLSTSTLTYLLRQFCELESQKTGDGRVSNYIGVFVTQWRIFSLTLRREWLRLYSSVKSEARDLANFGVFMEILALLRMICDCIRVIRHRTYTGPNSKELKMQLWAFGGEHTHLLRHLPQQELKLFCVQDLTALISVMVTFCKDFYDFLAHGGCMSVRELAAMAAALQVHSEMPEIDDLLSHFMIQHPEISVVRFRVGPAVSDIDFKAKPQSWVASLWRAVFQKKIPENTEIKKFHLATNYWISRQARSQYRPVGQCQLDKKEPLSYFPTVISWPPKSENRKSCSVSKPEWNGLDGYGEVAQSSFSNEFAGRMRTRLSEPEITENQPSRFSAPSTSFAAPFPPGPPPPFLPFPPPPINYSCVGEPPAKKACPAPDTQKFDFSWLPSTSNVEYLPFNNPGCATSQPTCAFQKPDPDFLLPKCGPSQSENSKISPFPLKVVERELGVLTNYVSKLRDKTPDEFGPQITKILNLQDFAHLGLGTATETGCERLKLLSAEAERILTANELVIDRIKALMDLLTKLFEERRKKGQETRFAVEKLNLERDLLHGTILVLRDLLDTGSVGSHEELYLRLAGNSLERYFPILREKLAVAASRSAVKVVKIKFEQLLNVQGLSMNELLVLVKSRTEMLRDGK